MLTKPCAGPSSRRDFLRAGTLALGGLCLADLLAARAAAGGRDPGTSVILFWMWGGPSQIETFDPKPDAPAEYRGPFRPTRTNVPGIDICELFPGLAKLADKYALVRSLHHTMSAHNDGSIELLTGKTPTRPDPTSTAFSEHPDFGMITSRLRGLRRDGVPQYVGIPTQPFMTRPTYLGLSHMGFTAGNPALPTYAPPKVYLSPGVDPQRLDDRRALLGSLDTFRRDLDHRGLADDTGNLRTAALHLLTNADMAWAFDLGREDARVRDRYGRHLWGQSCLLARRLAEAGAGVVTVDAVSPEQGKPVYFSWDDHANAQAGWDLAAGMRWRAPFMDQALGALIDDVYARGLDRRILIVAVGEFGRTPRLTQANGCIGRDHWPDAMSALVAGGGLRMGQVVGATNRRGEFPKERPLTPQDLLATVYRHLGIATHHEFRDQAGKPTPVLFSGEPIRELI